MNLMGFGLIKMGSIHKLSIRITFIELIGLELKILSPFGLFIKQVVSPRL